MSSDGWSRGDWMQTATGKQFFPLDPRPEDIDIVDIALALSKICRYGGHCRQFYSVAEHCVLIARYLRKTGAPIKTQRAGLMHDASEAYLADIIRPIKPFLDNYLPIEDRLMHVVADRFDFEWPVPASVKACDVAILHDEMLQNMAPPPAQWKQIESGPLGVTLEFWSPERAFAEFVSEAHAVGVA